MFQNKGYVVRMLFGDVTGIHVRLLCSVLPNECVQIFHLSAASRNARKCSILYQIYSIFKIIFCFNMILSQLLPWSLSCNQDRGNISERCIFAIEMLNVPYEEMSKRNYRVTLRLYIKHVILLHCELGIVYI